MKENDMIKVHFYDWITGEETKTGNYDKVFKVHKIDGELGIYWNDDGNKFSPFHTFCHSVIFENVQNGDLYHFSNFKKGIERYSK